MPRHAQFWQPPGNGPARIRAPWPPARLRSIVRTVPGPSFIPQEDLIRGARVLAAGKSLKRAAADLEWDINRMRRCVTRLDTEVRVGGERHWFVMRETALEWLRMRGLCTPDELERAVSMARQQVVDRLPGTLRHGAQLQSEGDHPQAERMYLRSLSDDPENVTLTAALAGCLLEMGRLKEALERFDFALFCEPDAAEVRFGRAITLYRMGRKHDAVAELEIAHRCDPDEAHMQVWLGSWRMELNRCRDENVELVKRAMAIVTRSYANRDDSTEYCCGVTEPAFFTLWDHGYADEAMAVASAAKIHGWMTEEMARVIKGREEARARRADEARASALACLSRIEPPSAPQDPPSRDRTRPRQPPSRRRTGSSYH